MSMLHTTLQATHRCTKPVMKLYKANLDEFPVAHS